MLSLRSKRKPVISPSYSTRLKEHETGFVTLAFQLFLSLYLIKIITLIIISMTIIFLQHAGE